MPTSRGPGEQQRHINAPMRGPTGIARKPRQVAAIVDCYTVEPSGLGVPPYLSAYARAAFGALKRAFPSADVRYLTIDDVRWCGNGGRPFTGPPLSDQLTYSATVNRPDAVQILADAAVLVVIAGDAVPSVHLQARNGSLEEIGDLLALARGRRVLVGPLATQMPSGPHAHGCRFDAVHSHTVTSADLLSGSRGAAAYERLAADRVPYAELITQLCWRPVAEIELYRGCTRRRFCSFCNEPVKSPLVSFRDPADVLAEITALYTAGIRNFRLGQQTCFFSYLNRDTDAIGRLLAQIREQCPELEVLHIDNADPLAVASRTGAKTAAGRPVLHRGELRPDGDRELRPGRDRGERAHLHPADPGAGGGEHQRGRSTRGAAGAAGAAAGTEPGLRAAR